MLRKTINAWNMAVSCMLSDCRLRYVEEMLGS